MTLKISKLSGKGQTKKGTYHVAPLVENKISDRKHTIGRLGTEGWKKRGVTKEQEETLWEMEMSCLLKR